MTANDKYISWLNSEALDAETRKELEAIKNDEKQIEDRFYKDLEFGTGGLRAKMGAGTSMMNTYTVAHATEGVARLIDSLGEEAKARGVIIGRDSRNNSDVFARRSAEVLSAHGIKVYLYTVY